MGVGDTFHLAPVGVYFGDGEDADGTVTARPGATVEDPYFGGAGPSRRACVECGECMTGCRHGAKNTLNENYLYLAERAGAVIHPMTSVVAVTEDGTGGHRVTTVPTGARGRRGRRARTVLRARQVVIAAGTYGTQTLLHTMRDEGLLPRIPARLGELTRTNSEALVARRPTTGATARGTARPEPTSPGGSPSPPRSTRTPTPMWSRSVTAGAPTRWGCCPYSKSRTASGGCARGSATRPRTRSS